MKTRNSHGLLQLGREALAYCQCASALISGNKALFVSVDLIGEKNQVILELLINHAFKLHIYAFHEKVKASHYSAQVKHLYESYFLLLKNPALSEVKRYVFDSLLKHQLTRDNTFTLIRSCGSEVYKVEKSKENT